MTIRVVQGLRGLAALLVISLHLGNPSGFEAHYLAARGPILAPLARLGSIGVDLFFVISGFIMIVSTLRSDGRSLGPLEFLKRRCIRIYPAVWIVNVIVLSVYLRYPNLVNSHSVVRPNILASFLLLPQTGAPLVLVTWTLVFEMYFYAVFAAALVCEAKFFKVVLIGWGFTIVAMSRILVHAHGPYAAYLSRPIAFEFLIGAAVGGLAMKRVPFRVSMVIFAVGALTLSGYVVELTRGSIDYPDGWARVLFAVPIAMTMFGLIAIEHRTGPFIPRFAERIGDASFAMYLLHVPMLTVIGLAFQHERLVGRTADIVALAVAYVTITCVGYLFFTLVERPLTTFLRHGVRRRRAEIAI